jgi:hypothetical protein
MGALFRTVLAFLLGSTVTASVVVIAILKNPEKVEKWIALVWSGVLRLNIGIRSAHKAYVQHDFQGRVNEFVKRHSREMPGFQVKGVKLNWETADTKRKAFIEADRVVVRVRREDPHHENFVKAVYLFVSTSLLYRAKRYISPSQGRAIDLFVTMEIFKSERPEVVDYFLERYLHPDMDDTSAKTSQYFDKFIPISKAGLFYPVFLQEMDYLGQKVFGARKSQQIVVEVNELIDFLEAIALRRVGDEKTELHFVQQYCRFAIVIVGKQPKLEQSTTPYVKFVQGLDRNTETVYLIGRAENERKIQQVCAELSETYVTTAEKKLSKVILYGEEKRTINGFVAVLRSKQRELYAPTDPKL